MYQNMTELNYHACKRLDKIATAVKTAMSICDQADFILVVYRESGTEAWAGSAGPAPGVSVVGLI